MTPICSRWPASGVKKKRRKAQDSAVKYLFCEGPTTNTKPLHQVATFEIDARVRECATNLQDHNLIAKLSKGDLIALGAAYHTHCFVSMYNRDRDRPQISGNCDTSTAHSRQPHSLDLCPTWKGLSKMRNCFLFSKCAT